MRVILISMGTAGDVYPFIGLGIALCARNHSVTLMANEHYRDLADRYQFTFVPLISDEETERLLADSDIWHPIKSALAGARWAGPLIARQYAAIREQAEIRNTVLVAYPPVFAARLVQETTVRPLVSVVPMPWMIPSRVAPPRLAGVLNIPEWTPSALRSALWGTLEVVADTLIGQHVNQLRQSIGLQRIRGIARWSYSTQLTIGMFPPWYAAPQPDWPPHTQLVGFSRFDASTEPQLSPDLVDFCQAGDRPIVFTFGTGMMHAKRLFSTMAAVVERLGVQGILLSRYAAQIPDRLPSSILHRSYVPLGKLLPYCAAIVHHGGLGTTAHALAAGIPQLILPLAWDQQDNAQRVKRLEVGNWVAPKSSIRRVALRLSKILTPDVVSRCGEIASRFGSEDASTLAADRIEALAVGHRNG